MSYYLTIFYTNAFTSFLNISKNGNNKMFMLVATVSLITSDPLPSIGRGSPATTNQLPSRLLSLNYTTTKLSGALKRKKKKLSFLNKIKVQMTSERKKEGNRLEKRNAQE